jgi:hypothetical protein
VRTRTLAGVLVAFSTIGIIALAVGGGGLDPFEAYFCGRMFALLELIALLFLGVCMLRCLGKEDLNERDRCSLQCFIIFMVLSIVFIGFYVGCLVGSGLWR